jgi:DNA-binding CsgD family transcriptional regulator
MERYTIIDFRSHVAAELIHNAPLELEEEVLILEVRRDPVVTRAKQSRIPVVWRSGSGGGDWRELNGDFGYRCGVAAAVLDGSGTGCMLMVSGAAEKLPDAHASTLLAYTLSAAGTINAPLRKLAAEVLAACPLSEDEIDCLHFTLAGLSYKEAARALGISTKAVYQSLESARARLGVKTSHAAAAMALSRGWLDMERAWELTCSGSAAAGTGKI